MPKIRGIKPEYWTDEAVVELSIPARLLFIGMWNFACDNGHLDDKPRQLKMRILPADDVDVEQLLVELEETGRIRRRAGTITIPKFASHQRPHKRWWTTCDLPTCTRPDDENGGSTGGQPLVNGGPTATDVTDVTDGDGDVDAREAPPRRRPAAKAAAPHRLPSRWAPTPQHHTQAADAGIDLDRAVFRFRNHATATARKVADWDALFTNWLDTEHHTHRPRTDDTDPWANLPETELPDPPEGA